MTLVVRRYPRSRAAVRPILTGLVSAALCSAIPANAQNAEDAVLEEVVVKGYRSSLSTSLNVKRESAVMVDTIIAEDIGQFPDNNLAESMARIPGVTISRDQGRGKNIAVRGLNSTFTRTLINGVEAQAIEWGTTDRGFDFNVFASDLFRRIDVRKSTEASMEEGSLGATVDLYTARPFDFDGNRFAVTAEVGHSDLADDYDPRVSGLLSFQNDDRTLGAAFSVAYSDTHTAQQQHNSGRWEANTGTGINMWANAASLPDEVNAAYHPRFPRYFNDTTNYESLGITGAFQWAPADATMVTLDVLYSQFDQYQSGPALTPISLSRTHPGGRIQTTVNDYEYDASRNALVYADLSGVDIRSENRDRYGEADMTLVTLAFDQDFGDRLHLKVLAGTSDSTSGGTESLAINEAFDVDFTYDYRNGGQSDPTFTYGFDLTDPASWLISEVRYADSSIENTYDTLRADFTWDLNDTFKLSGGVSRKEYEFDLYNINRNTNLHADANQGVVAPPAGCGITQQQIQVGADIGHLYTDWQGQTYFLADWDPYAAQVGFPPGGSLTDPCFALTPGSSGRRNVQETDTGAYLQVDVQARIGGMDFFGNAGVRYVETEVSSTGDIGTDPITVDREYDDTLPALNLGLWVTDDVVVRASWAKVMARPNLADLSPGGSVDGFNRRYTAGNPGLEPFRADATDLAVEWYFAEEALVSVAYFRKDIESFPQRTTVTVPWRALGLPDSLLDNSPANPTELFDYTSLQTGPGGDLDGWEFQFQTPFSFGPEWVRDFGIRLNYTDITSEVIVGSTSTGAPIYGRLTGQSNEAYNFTLWYENAHGFSGRISTSYTGDYATSSISRFTVPGGIDAGEDITDEVQFVDAKLSYQFSDALSFSLEGLNLTSETVTTLMGTNGFLLEDQSNTPGRQFYFGLQYQIW